MKTTVLIVGRAVFAEGAERERLEDVFLTAAPKLRRSSTASGAYAGRSNRTSFRRLSKTSSRSRSPECGCIYFWMVAGGTIPELTDPGS